MADKRLSGTVGQYLRVVHRAMQEHSRRIEKEFGVSAAQLTALWELSAHPGCRVSELSQALMLHQSTTSNMLDKMQKRGLIRRERIDSDQRVVRLFVTESGESMLRDLPGPGRGLLPDALARLGSDELEQVDEALALILGKLERRPASAPPAAASARPAKGGA